MKRCQSVQLGTLLYRLAVSLVFGHVARRPGLRSCRLHAQSAALGRVRSHGVFFDAVVKKAKDAGLCSDDHFSVDGTLIESWASMKSFRPKDEPEDQDKHDDSNSFKPRNPDVDFHGQKRSVSSERPVTISYEIAADSRNSR